MLMVAIASGIISFRCAGTLAETKMSSPAISGQRSHKARAPAHRPMAFEKAEFWAWGREIQQVPIRADRAEAPAVSKRSLGAIRSAAPKSKGCIKRAGSPGFSQVSASRYRRGNSVPSASSPACRVAVLPANHLGGRPGQPMDHGGAVIAVAVADPDDPDSVASGRFQQFRHRHR